jgi:hypothetical protein
MRSTALWLLVPLLAAGCGVLLTQTRFFEYDLLHDGQPLTPGVPIVLTDGGIVELSVDMSEVDLYEEHEDEIEAVDRAGLEAVLSPSAATRFSLYLSRSSGLSDPASQATPLWRGYAVGASERELDFDATEAEMSGLDELEAAILAGGFQLYLVGEGPTLTFDELNLVVAFTIGL